MPMMGIGSSQFSRRGQTPTAGGQGAYGMLQLRIQQQQLDLQQQKQLQRSRLQGKQLGKAKRGPAYAGVAAGGGYGTGALPSW